MPLLHRAAVVAIAAASLSGCATWLDGTHQNIAISTPPTQGAYCVLTRPGGRFVVTTPGVLHLDKASGDLAIHCSRPGFADADGTIPSEFQGTVLGNLVFGVVPAAVDVADGATHAYPGDFALPMTPLGAARSYAQPVSPYTPARTQPPAPPSGTALPGTLPDNF
jgi:hypothetical protein